MRTALLTVAAAYLFLAVLLYFLQEQILFPGARTQGQAIARVEPPAGADLLRLRTRSGHHVAALFLPARNAAGKALDGRRPTILFFYGNGSWLHSALPVCEELQRLGAGVLVPEYLGYGLSDGSPGEAGVRETADAAYDYLLTRPGVDPHRIFAVGYSLGGAAAIDLASRHPLAGLATLNAFSSMREMAALCFPYLPTSLLLRHPFESRSRISRVHCPILLVHGTADELVPFRMRDRLAAAAGGPVTRLDIPGGTHNDLFGVAGPRILAALSRLLRNSGSESGS
ncbi:MAG TPA: alpha/beta hydrolase [Armatimonadota bacterium]|nr:alpha/beta hydrolase [Armatimonadota bacterium]